MLLSIVIPAYNEEKRIGASLQELQDFLPNHFEQTEVIVVNDGSSDKTSQAVRAFETSNGKHNLETR
jgi:dolichyl-phosphate beta-glucosyltransferase